jgi:hypothetical protein
MRLPGKLFLRKGKLRKAIERRDFERMHEFVRNATERKLKARLITCI